MVSFSVVSEMAMVPESEWRTPTLIGSAHSANAAVPEAANASAEKDEKSVLRIVKG